MLPSPKDRPSEEKQTNVVYQINCADCSWKYIGETGRSLQTRKKEHIRDVKKCKVGHRRTLESWHTAITINADNNAKHLPEQYRFLLQ